MFKLEMDCQFRYICFHVSSVVLMFFIKFSMDRADFQLRSKSHLMLSLSIMLTLSIRHTEENRVLEDLFKSCALKMLTSSVIGLFSLNLVNFESTLANSFSPD